MSRRSLRAPAVQPKSGREQADEQEASGAALMAAGEWAKAATCYEEALEHWERYKEALCLSRCEAKLGTCAFEQKDFPRALRHFTKQASDTRVLF